MTTDTVILTPLARRSRALGNGKRICSRCLYVDAPTAMSGHIDKCWPAPVVDSGMAAVREWADGEVEKRELEARLRRVKARQRERENSVLEYLASEGIDLVSIDAGTIYHTSTVWASIVGDPDAAHAALRAEGLGELVKERVNTQTLSAWVRELGVDAIPPSLEPHLKISTRHAARLRRR